MGYGVWQATLILGVGSYEFKYRNGGAREEISGSCTEGGYSNRQLTVVDSPLILMPCATASAASVMVVRIRSPRNTAHSLVRTTEAA